MLDDAANFADAPETIGEARSDRSWSAADWAPRDLLVSLLRRIDRGELNPDALVVLYSWHGGPRGARQVSYSASSPDVLTTHGLIALATARMMRDGGE